MGLDRAKGFANAPNEEEGMRRGQDGKKNGKKSGGRRGGFGSDRQCCGRSEDEEFPVKATPGKLFALRSITWPYQLTGPAGRMVCLQRGIIVTVPFL